MWSTSYPAWNVILSSTLEKHLEVSVIEPVITEATSPKRDWTNQPVLILTSQDTKSVTFKSSHLSVFSRQAMTSWEKVEKPIGSTSTMLFSPVQTGARGFLLIASIFFHWKENMAGKRTQELMIVPHENKWPNWAHHVSQLTLTPHSNNLVSREIWRGSHDRKI